MKRSLYLFLTLLLYTDATNSMEKEAENTPASQTTIPALEIPYLHLTRIVQRNATNEIEQWAQESDSNRAISPKPNNPLTSMKRKRTSPSANFTPAINAPSVINCGIGYPALRQSAMDHFFHSNAALQNSKQFSLGELSNFILTVKVLYMVEDLGSRRLKRNVDAFGTLFKDILPHYCTTVIEFSNKHTCFLKEADQKASTELYQKLDQTVYYTQSYHFHPITYKQSRCIEDILVTIYYLINSPATKTDSDMEKLENQIHSYAKILPSDLQNGLVDAQDEFMENIKEIEFMDILPYDTILLNKVHILLHALDHCTYHLFTQKLPGLDFESTKITTPVKISATENKIQEPKIPENKPTIITNDPDHKWKTISNIVQRILLLGLTSYFIYINRRHLVHFNIEPMPTPSGI
jgi:hypothetical protein